MIMSIIRSSRNPRLPQLQPLSARYNLSQKKQKRRKKAFKSQASQSRCPLTDPSSALDVTGTTVIAGQLNSVRTTVEATPLDDPTPCQLPPLTPFSVMFFFYEHRSRAQSCANRNFGRTSPNWPGLAAGARAAFSSDSYFLPEMRLNGRQPLRPVANCNLTGVLRSDLHFFCDL